jgi:hypothetical protein
MLSTLSGYKRALINKDIKRKFPQTKVILADFG